MTDDTAHLNEAEKIGTLVNDISNIFLEKAWPEFAKIVNENPENLQKAFLFFYSCIVIALKKFMLNLNQKGIELSFKDSLEFLEYIEKNIEEITETEKKNEETK